MSKKDKIFALLQDAVERRVFPGCAAAWAANGELDNVAAGRYTYDDDAAAVAASTVYDCASVTKAIPVSCLALHLIDNNMLRLDDLLIKYVPEYRGAHRGGIRVKHLLTHTLDFDFRLSDHKDLPPELLLDAILGADMKNPPDAKFCYANATSILLGMVIESAAKKSLHILADEIFFAPLNMKDTAFFPSGDMLARCAPTEIDPWRGREIRGETHDESAWALRKIMTAGSAGLFSTANDLAKFIDMLINRADNFFSNDMITAMYTNQIPHIHNQQTGLGWELNQEYMGKNRAPSTFGKTGFTGTCVMIDPVRKTGLVMLSNCAYPTRKPDREEINKIRAEIADIVFG